MLTYSLFLIFRYRATVIRNLPQLQKLDNVAVQPDEVADAVRRGIELVHPYDRDVSQPQSYNAYANQTPASQPQQPQSFQVSHYFNAFSAWGSVNKIFVAQPNFCTLVWNIFIVGDVTSLRSHQMLKILGIFLSEQCIFPTLRKKCEKYNHLLLSQMLF